MLKIIHAADIHLDAPFALTNPIEAERRRNELRSVFTSLMLYAKTFGAQIFLIPGDLFDSAYVTKDTAQMIYKEISSFPECKFFITPGNHDPYDDSSPYRLLKWPENTYIFKNEALSFVDVPEYHLRVYGYAYQSKTIRGDLFAGFTVEDPEKINILCAHGFVNTPLSACNAIMASEIETSGFDYIALGHIHSFSGICQKGKTYYAFSGCLEGRSFDETGDKGVIAGEIGKGTVNLKGIKLSPRKFEKVEIDISGLASTEEVLSKVAEMTKSYYDDTALRITLTGIISPKINLSQSLIRTVVTKPFYIELADETLPILDAEHLKSDPTLLGAYYRKIEPLLYSENKEERTTAALALRYGLNVLSGNELNLD